MVVWKWETLSAVIWTDRTRVIDAGTLDKCGRRGLPSLRS